MLKGYYVAKNKRTGERKKFDTYDEMQYWYVGLSTEEMMEWGSWDFVY